MTESPSNPPSTPPSPRPDSPQAPIDTRSGDHIQDRGDAGYNKSLKNRHLQMIAIGGSIGTGLFMGAGGRLEEGGAGLMFAYAVCGIFAFLMVRALGELAIRRPSSGAFVSYAREFLGEKGAYITGWFFFLDWSVTVMADITAVALYLHYWTTLQVVPQWVFALIALMLVFILNMLNVKMFGEAEFCSHSSRSPPSCPSWWWPSSPLFSGFTPEQPPTEGRSPQGLTTSSETAASSPKDSRSSSL